MSKKFEPGDELLNSVLMGILHQRGPFDVCFPVCEKFRDFTAVFVQKVSKLWMIVRCKMQKANLIIIVVMYGMVSGMIEF